ncbi:maleate cis-trans isomerase family protein [Roseitranquillus sediminis]|uniref:maleate cis-trans isomerase family protein n=1 Tax=Roseitranquillus sediminis TaxID=2809051 RepID=UPI001D0C4057|nr:ectoine utilization protein EutA [Roseitranquillus sediminis]MBM9593951.1 aspartate/glutamate racemase family protein [Roseitranquillus sediminis]
MEAASPSRIAPHPAELEKVDRFARLGFVALATDLTFERDAARVIPPELGVMHVARIHFVNPTTPANLLAMKPRLTEAVSRLVPGHPLACVGFGCTSGSIVIGDAEVDAAIAAARPRVPVVTPARAVRHALAALRVRRLALMAPYVPETTEPMMAYLEAAGFEVVGGVGLGLADDGDIARVTSDCMVRAARAADSAEAEALFMPCTSLPAMAVAARIEAELGKPVLTSNQVTLWSMLGHAGLPMPQGYGRIFGTPLPDLEVA